jgi:HSP20 family molecular chaperone IbpA
VFEFEVPGVASIKELELEMKRDCVRLKVQGKKELLVPLAKPIDQHTAKAKLKKAHCTLRLEAKFL